jgi:hypothetical protein
MLTPTLERVTAATRMDDSALAKEVAEIHHGVLADVTERIQLNKNLMYNTHFTTGHDGERISRTMVQPTQLDQLER